MAPDAPPASRHPRAAWASLTVAAAATAVAWLTCTTVNDPDTWWLLADGRRLLGGDLANTNAYSHVAPDHPWQKTQWLFSLLLAGLQRLVGPDALSAVPVVFALATFAVVASSMGRQAGRLAPGLAVALLVAGVVASRFTFVPRAHLATLLGLALLHRLWLGRPRGWRLTAALVGLVWANLHSGVVFGTLFLAVLAAALAAEGRRDRAVETAVAAVAFFVASLANPFGVAYLHVWDALKIVGSGTLGLGEMQPPVWSQHLAFLALATIGVAALAPDLPQRRLTDAAAFAVFTAAALLSKRLIPLPMVLLLPALYERAQALSVGWPRGSRAVTGALALALVGTAAVDLHRWWPTLPPAWGYDRAQVPEGAAAFVEEHDLQGVLYNDYDQGGYLAWRLYPGRRILIDGRVPAYPEEAARLYWATATGTAQDLRRLIDRYGLTYAIAQRRQNASEVDVTAHFRELGWRLVYFDGISAVYLGPGFRAAGTEEPPALEVLRPGVAPEELFGAARTDPDGVLGELRRLVPARLLDPVEHHLFGTAAYFAGDPAQADEFYRAGLAADPGNLGVLLARGGALEALGRTEEARGAYREVERRAPGGHHARLAAEALAALDASRGGNPR